MLAIEVNGEFLDLKSSIKYQFDAYSPLFQTDGVIKDDTTIPFIIEATDKNKRILKNPQLIENFETFKPRYTAKLWWKGVPKLTGQLRIDEVVSNDEISIYLTFGLSEIAADLRERSLRDIMDELIVIHDTDFDKRVRLIFIGNASQFTGLEINGKPFEGDDLEELRDNINADTELGATASIEVFGSPPAEITVFVIIPDGNELEPFNVKVDVEEIETSTGTVLKSYWNFIEAPFIDLYQSTYDTFFSQYRGENPDRKLRFATFSNLYGFDDSSSLKDYPAVNLQTELGLVPNKVVTSNPFFPGNTRPAYITNSNSIAPQVTLNYIIEKIEAYYDITINYPPLEEEETIVILSPNTLDVPLEYWNGKKFIFYKRSFNIADFVPDMPVNEFLKALQSMGYSITYDPLTRSITYTEKNSVIESPDYIDMTGKHSEVRSISNPEKEGVTLGHMDDPDNQYLSEIKNFTDGSLNYVFGKGEKPVSTRFSVPDLAFPTPWPADAISDIMVILDQSPKTKFALKLAYVSNYGNWLSTWVYGRSLSWNSEFGLYAGLYERLWDNWVVMEDNVTTAKVTLTVPESWIWTPFWTRKFLIDRSKFLIKSFSVVLEDAEEMQIECEIVKVPYAVRSVSNPGVPIGVPQEEEIPVNPLPLPPDPELGEREVSLEMYGGEAYYKLIEDGLTYGTPSGGSTVITSSSAIFDSNDEGKMFCGLFAHQNSATPDDDLYYPGILGSRYCTIIEVISSTQIRVDFEFNTGSEKGYIFFDNSAAFHSALSALNISSTKDVLRLLPGQTYVVREFQQYALAYSLYIISSAQSALKIGWEDYFTWSPTKTIDQAGTLFDIDTNNINVGILNVDFLPPSRRIAETQSATPRFFENTATEGQTSRLALVNCRTDREFEALTNPTLENPQGWGWGNLYAGGAYTGSGSEREVSDFLYLIAKNYSHRGQGLMDLKANYGGGLYLVAEDIDSDYNPKSDFNPHYFLTSIKFTTDRSGFSLGIPSKTHYPSYVPEITDNESFYKIANQFYNQGWNNRLCMVHLDRFTFWLHPSSYQARVYDPLFDRSGSPITWPISDSYSYAMTGNKAMIAVIPEVGQTYRISRHYPMASDKVMGAFSDNIIRDHINWCAVLDKPISSIDPATEIPLNSKPIELQPGDQFTIVGYVATVYTVTAKERGSYPNMPSEYQWFNSGQESQYVFNQLTLDTNLPGGLPVDFEIEMVTSGAEYLLDGTSRPAYIAYKGNSQIALTETDTFGESQILYSSGFGYISYNHKEITVWAKNFNHDGFYRQSSNGRAIVSPSDVSQGYVMINCTGFADEFNPDEPIETTPTTMPAAAQEFIDFLESL